MEEWERTETDAEDIQEKIKRLARSYTPEWNFDTLNPDAGSVIGLIFAKQMEDNLRSFRQALSKYRIEFVNLYGGSLRPARPATAIVIMEASGRAGVRVRKGTRLTGTDQNGGEVIFETARDLFVTGCALTDIVGISSKAGRIVPYYGGMRETPLLPELETKEEKGKDFPIELFSFEEKGIYREALIFHDECLFDQTDEICLRFQGETASGELAELFTDEEHYGFSYYDGICAAPFESVGRRGDFVVLKKGRTEGNIRPEENGGTGRPESAVFLERRKYTDRAVYLTGVETVSPDRQAAPDFVHNTVTELEPACFSPFGDSLSLYQECYIGQDAVFSQKGASARLEFSLSFEEKHLEFAARAREDKLPVIKRRNKYSREPEAVRCFPQEISAEYFNGTGWKRLPGIPETLGIFDAGQGEGKAELLFDIPHDWQPVTVGGYEKRCIRLLLIRADNCYMRPAVHYCPVLRDVRLSCGYGGRALRPAGVERLYGKNKADLTESLAAGGRVCAFGPFPYEGTAVYFGLDGRPEEGPVSLYLALEDKASYAPSRNLSFEYSAASGFRPFKVTDHTDGLRSPGTILFDPPSDMAPYELEGCRRYWLRIVCGDGFYGGQGVARAQAVFMNAVAAQNVETREPREYFIDKPAAHMSFPLYADNILDARVWVNETDHFTKRRGKELLASQPERFRAEYGAGGEIQELYVKWEERESFVHSKKEDRHYVIDRVNGRLLFGDGVHVRIPENTSGTAFTVSLRCCGAGPGNVPAGGISGFSGSLPPVGRIYNDRAAYGGAAAESMENALLRGAGVLGSAGRLITGEDYEREIRTFSPNVDKVRCIADVDRNTAPRRGLLSLVVLMKDYRSGSGSFRMLKRELEEELGRREALQSAPGELVIVEPVFVEINVSLWLTVRETADTFDTKNRWKRRLEEYLDPVSRKGGWEIGSLPSENQLRMFIHTWEREERVERFAVSAAWTDASGFHETPLRAVNAVPFMVCSSGKHEISVERTGREERLC